MDDAEAASLAKVVTSWLALIDARGAKPNATAQRGIAALVREHPGVAARYPDVAAAADVPLTFLASAERDAETWITPAQAAKLTGLTAHGVRDAVRQGRLKAKKHGGRWAVDEQSARTYGRDGDVAGRGSPGGRDMGPEHREAPVHAARPA